VIAIDGPAGAGKSTIARALAARLGLAHLDTGAMYRAVTLAVIRAGMAPEHKAEVAAIASTIEIEVDGGVVRVDGEDVSDAIRSPEVNGAVSVVAANSAVRAGLVRRQRAWGEAHGGGVIEGRDIGSVVFPEALVKLYLTASPRVRAERRQAESGGDLGTIEASIASRDTLDSTRADSPLVRADGSVVLDTTGLGIDEVVDRIVALVDAAARERA